ncbi:hypothetical protein [Moorena bouillonii]|uniref:hypothetical protein n=1 Tax=Moorena bouillonii TaxID=207920 RepID=UPI0013011776|nr:hypothetical protein [Moorena bouillonii]
MVSVNHGSWLSTKPHPLRVGLLTAVPSLPFAQLPEVLSRASDVTTLDVDKLI